MFFFLVQLVFCANIGASAEVSFLEQRDHVYKLDNVQVLKRNPAIGPDYLRDFRFSHLTSLPMPEENFEGLRIENHFIGLDSSNGIYHVVSINGHRMARLLSGKKCIKEFQLDENTQSLLALSCEGEALVYDSSLWFKSPVKMILKERAVHSVVGAVGISLLSYFVTYHMGGAEIDPNMEQLIFLFSSMLGISVHTWLQGAVAFMQYDRLNEKPDGFKKFGYRLQQLSQLPEQALSQLKKNTWVVNCTALLSYALPEEILEKY